jgi:hypothetical protein
VCRNVTNVTNFFLPSSGEERRTWSEVAIDKSIGIDESDRRRGLICKKSVVQAAEFTESKLTQVANARNVIGYEIGFTAGGFQVPSMIEGGVSFGQ